MEQGMGIDWQNKNYEASWGVFKFPADANKVAKELEGINDNGEFTAQEVVDFAENPYTEMHNCFEWDDAIAANGYRCQQARQMIQSLKITFISKDKEPEKTEIRYFSHTERRCGEYKKTEVMVRKPDEYQKLLSNAKAELQTFKNKYKRLSELEEVFEAIDRL